MAYSPKGVMDIFEILTRWHSGYTISGIGDALGIDRKTVRRYVRAAEEGGISREKPLPEREALIEHLLPLVPNNKREMPARCQFEQHRDEIVDLITRPIDPLKPKTAFEVICIRHGTTASYSSFKRFVRHNVPELSPNRTTCRVEVEPGAEIQIDYASMGLLHDEAAGRNRKVYAFIATLSNCRYKYIEFVHSQNQKSFAASHVRMFSFFFGVSRCLIPEYVPRHILRDMWPSTICGRQVLSPVKSRRFSREWEHNIHRDWSHSSKFERYNQMLWMRVFEGVS